MIRISSVSILVACALSLGANATSAAVSPEQQCQAGKNKAAGKYAACRGNAKAKLATAGDTAKYDEAIAKCTSSFASTWQKLENKAVAAGTTCPSAGDATGIGGRITVTTDTIAALAGGTRWVDNGDGTVSDHQTGLQWEQKTTAPGSGVNLFDPRDVDNKYTLSSAIGGTTPNGTAYTDFLPKLNGASFDGATLTGCFAGHCDWRLPTIVELQTVLLGTFPCAAAPCVDPVFNTNLTNYYWSSTEHADDPTIAWFLWFANGNVSAAYKGDDEFVRAVRGGL